MDGMETEDPFASLGGLGSGLGANFGPRNAPFRSQSFNVGSNSTPKKDKMQDPAVEHDLYVSLDDINKVGHSILSDQNYALVYGWSFIMIRTICYNS